MLSKDIVQETHFSVQTLQSMREFFCAAGLMTRLTTILRHTLSLRKTNLISVN